MRVGELAAATGVPARTIRFYESEGVLPTPARRPNGYRDYGAEDLCRVRLVATLRGLGLDLTESAGLAALCISGQGDVMVERLRSQVHVRRNDVAAARAELRHLDAELARLETSLEAGASAATFCIGDPTCIADPSGAPSASCSCGPGCPCGQEGALSAKRSEIRKEVPSDV